MEFQSTSCSMQRHGESKWLELQLLKSSWIEFIELWRLLCAWLIQPLWFDMRIFLGKSIKKCGGSNRLACHLITLAHWPNTFLTVPDFRIYLLIPLPQNFGTAWDQNACILFLGLFNFLPKIASKRHANEYKSQKKGRNIGSQFVSYILSPKWPPKVPQVS